MINLIERATTFEERKAVISEGRSFTYGELLDASALIGLDLLDGLADLQEQRVAFIVPPGFDYVAIQWAIWRAGGIAVPLCVKHPLPALRHVIEDAQASVIIFSREFDKVIEPLREHREIRFMPAEAFRSVPGDLPEVDPQRKGMILYTSGTTGAPKGVVLSHRHIEAQITSLTDSWEWTKEDHILNVLPLHHTHGIINILSCALWSGACCEFLPFFDPEKVFQVFKQRKVNVFMAVPTVYFQLISYWEQLPEQEKEEISSVLKKFRLMVSGSAALPVSVMQKWKEISGHELLERYGMTEMGMAISNPYRGERRPGHIGQPLKNVQIRIADEQNFPLEAGIAGEIQVKGPNVFHEYWNKPAASRDAFTADGWFKTGDTAVLEEGSYKILGRNSVDIIKSGGYKISALEIEEVLRTHPKINDCAVVGIRDLEWGEIVAASLILQDGELDIAELKEWLRQYLPGYKIPRKYLIQEELPRNMMGKVTKNELKNMFSANLTSNS